MGSKHLYCHPVTADVSLATKEQIENGEAIRMIARDAN